MMAGAQSADLPKMRHVVLKLLHRLTAEWGAIQVERARDRHLSLRQRHGERNVAPGEESGQVHAEREGTLSGPVQEVPGIPLRSSRAKPPFTAAQNSAANAPSPVPARLSGPFLLFRRNDAINSTPRARSPRNVLPIHRCARVESWWVAVGCT